MGLPPEPIPSEVLEIIEKTKDKMDRCDIGHVYRNENGEFVVKIDRMRDRYLDLDIGFTFPPDLLHIDVDKLDDEDGVTYLYDGDGDEPLPYDESLPYDGKNAATSKEVYDKGEKKEFGCNDENTEPLPGSLANKKVYGKKEIMELLQCGNQKALYFLKLLFQMKYAIKVGKSYLIRAEDFDRFFDDHKGQEIAI